MRDFGARPERFDGHRPPAEQGPVRDFQVVSKGIIGAFAVADALAHPEHIRPIIRHVQ